MNSKQLFSTTAVLAGFLIIAYIISLFSHPLSTIPSRSAILGGVATSTGGYEYREDAKYYTIEVLYPATSTLSSAANDKVVSTIEQKMADDIAQFKKDGNFANLTPQDIEIQRLGERKYVYESTYQSFAGSNTISYVYKIYVDSLGAHPNHYFETFVFDTHGGPLRLSDLFVNGADYLTPISQAATAAVTKQLQIGLEQQDVSIDIFAEGLAPKDENFSNWAIDGQTLHIYIPPYQAAAYVAGSFDVSIPLSQLSTILKPEFK